MTNESLKKLLKIADYLEKSSAPDIADEIKKCVSDIKSDSEILDLLKHYSGIVKIHYKNVELGEYFLCEINYKQDVEKLKEWLEND